MAKLLLEIVTPSRMVLQQEVEEVTVPGIQGEFGILAQHTPFISCLGTGTLTYRSGGVSQKYVINGGFAEVSDNHVIVLTETCESAQELDLDRARKALEESQKAILELDASTPEYEEQWARSKRAQARVEVAETADL